MSYAVSGIRRPAYVDGRMTGASTALLKVSVAMIACVLAATGCSEGSDEPPAELSEDDAQFVTFDGTLLGGDVEEVGRVRLEDGMSVVSVASDGRLLLSTDRDATMTWDCCGPDTQTIYTATADGSGEPEPLIPGQIGQADVSPDWSSDGDQVVFVRREAPVYPRDDAESSVEYGGVGVDPGVYVAGADGSDVRQLLAGEFFSTAWSPTDDVIAAVTTGEDDVGYEIVLVDARSGDIIHRFDTLNVSVAWSPDGTKLGHTVAGEDENPKVRTAIAIYDVASRRAKRVPNTATGSSSPIVWGPDGLLSHLTISGGYLLSLIDSADEPPEVVERCMQGEGVCPRPVHAFTD